MLVKFERFIGLRRVVVTGLCLCLNWGLAEIISRKYSPIRVILPNARHIIQPAL